MVIVLRQQGQQRLRLIDLLGAEQTEETLRKRL